MGPESPVVFIHYSWDNEPHKAWVLSLANRLVNDGVTVILDRYDLRIGGNSTYFMEKMIGANKVILIMTEEYKIKADNRTGGTGYEYQIISHEISKVSTMNTKFLPVLRKGNKEKSVPVYLQSFLYLNMTRDDLFEKQYLELLRDIYEEHSIVKPVLGKRPDLTNSNFSLKDILSKTKEEVAKLLGEAQQENVLVRRYWSHGVEVFFNRHSFLADGVLARRQITGVSYEDDFLGINLGDSFGEVKAKLGNPINWGLPYLDTSYAFYEVDDHYVLLSISRDTSGLEQNHIKPGTVTAIGYSTKGSVLSCEPIVAVAIEEIRKGGLPKLLENVSFSIKDVDLHAPYLLEKYDLIPTQINFVGGGYFVTLAFRQSKKYLDFWLYDLSWSTLVIRLISERDAQRSNT